MKTKLIIFGITGDLSRRKLLPAIGRIVATKSIENLEVIGISRREVDIAQLLEESIGKVDINDICSSFTMDLTKQKDYEHLKAFIQPLATEQILMYLSVPPQAATQIVDLLGEAGLNDSNIKLLFEKPFGIDLTSAREMIRRTSRYYKEEQIYRIDHYLAKEMAQNIVAFRGGNALFSHIWNADSIEKIEVSALESIGIEGRSQFYEQTGALRDFVQGHLLQLLSLILMEPLSDLDWTKLPRMRLEALRDIDPVDPSRVTRAQYEGYQDEVGNPGSMTETFVSLPVHSHNPRWNGTPIILTTGKAIDKKETEIRIYFRKLHEAQSNCLIFRIQPNEGVEIDLFTKRPGYDRKFDTQKLSFTYADGTVIPDAYEQVLVDAIKEHKSLFTSNDEVLCSWEILQPVLDAWEMNMVPLKTYPRGSSTHNICSV